MRPSSQHPSSVTLRPSGQIPEGWAGKPAKLRQENRDARWTVKFSKATPREDGAPQVDLAVPAFGYKNHIGIDRGHGLIRRWTATHAAAHDGARLEEVLDPGNSASGVWADTADRSAKNEAMLARRGLVSRIHRKKPPGRPMPVLTRRANARKSALRSAIEHVFARQMGPMGLVVRTLGIARARVKIGLANLAYNMKRLVWLSGRPAPASSWPIPAADPTSGPRTSATALPPPARRPQHQPSAAPLGWPAKGFWRCPDGSGRHHRSERRLSAFTLPPLWRPRIICLSGREH